MENISSGNRCLWQDNGRDDDVNCAYSITSLMWGDDIECYQLNTDAICERVCN